MMSAAPVLFALADGLSWRRAVEPSFDAEGVMPIVLRTVEQLLVSPLKASPGDQKGRGEVS